MTSEIGYELRDGVAVVSLLAPERRNALTLPMARDLVAALDTADDVTGTTTEVGDAIAALIADRA